LIFPLEKLGLIQEKTFHLKIGLTISKLGTEGKKETPSKSKFNRGCSLGIF
jgi:hypothetical protein